MTEILQIRDKFLRLNTEQVHHIVNGIVLQREEIDPDSIPVYDGQMNNVLEQLGQQGIHAQIMPKEIVVSDVTEKQQAQTLLAELYGLVMTVPTDQKQAIFNKLQEFERLLFGD